MEQRFHGHPNHGGTRAWARRPGALLLLLATVAACDPNRTDAPLPPLDLPPAPQRIAPVLPIPAHSPYPVILISIDTLRADHLGAYGYDRPTSPRIDDLARQGVLFEHAYSHAPKTAPSHMSLMTGLYPPAHGVRNLEVAGGSSLSPDVPTLAVALKAAGYRTVAVTGGGNVDRALGFGRGFDVYEHAAGGPDNFDRAIRYLHEALGPGSAGAPLFLFVHTFQVHDPYLPPAAMLDHFRDPEYGGRVVGDAEWLAAEAGDSWHRRHQLFWSRVDATNSADIRRLVDLYDACIRTTDQRVGRLLDTLEELGVADDSIVIVTSDHGEEFQEHGGFRHDSLFEELLRVPLILRLPASVRADPGGRIATQVGLVDVLPTLLEILGLPRPLHLQGRSLLGMLQGKPEPDRWILAHWSEAQATASALRRGRWKLIETGRGGVVFDLAADPEERAGRPSGASPLDRSLHRSLADVVRWSARVKRLSRPAAAVGLDPGTLRRLRALGYLGEAAP